MSSKLDGNQVLRQAFDEGAQRLKVSADVTATVSAATQEVVISDVDDSIKIGNGAGQYASVSGAGALKVDGSAVVQPVSEADYASRVDDTTTANVMYIGKAAVGSAPGSAVWQIKKVDTTSGVIITWADSNANFDNVWDNRAGLSYG